MKKFINVLATSALVVSVAAPFSASAAGAGSISAYTVPTLQQNSASESLGTIQVTIPQGALQTGDSVTLSLPHGFTLPAGAFTGAEAAIKSSSTLGSVGNEVYVVSGNTAADLAGSVTVLPGSNQIQLKVTAAGTQNDDVKIAVKLGAVVANGTNNGPVNVTLDAPNGSSFPVGTVTVGNVQTNGLVDLAVSDTTSGSNVFTMNLNVKEEVAGSLRTDSNSLKVKLPSGYQWDTAATPVNTAVLYGAIGANDTVAADIVNNLVITKSGDDTLYIKFTNPTTQATSLKIPLQFSVKDDSQVHVGDINAYFSGTSTINNSSAKVGVYGDYSATVTAASTPDVFSSRANQQIGDIVIKESVPGTFVNGRTITLTLPDSARWEDEFENAIANRALPGNPALNITTLNGVNVTPSFTGTDYRTLKLTVTGQSNGTDAGEIDLKNVFVATSARATGDLNVEVGGTVGVTGTVKIAAVKAPATITASATPNVVNGLNGQPMGDLVITEAVPGAFNKDTVAGVANDGRVKVTIDNSGVAWDKTPTVTVTDGDARVSNVYTSGQDLYFTIDGASAAKAATFTIAGGTLKIDNSSAEGPVKFKVRGDAASYAATKFNTWNNDTPTIAAVAAATITNTVANNTGANQNSAKFVIGQTGYTVNGQQKTSDVGAFVDENGRTQLPLRAVSEALGATVGWDQDSQTASILLNGKAVSVQVGSNKINVGGVVVAMDTEALNKDSRVFVPFRAIAEALGAKVSWDATTQTVSLN